MHLAHEDETKREIRAGQSYVIDPGQDASVVGVESVVGFDFDLRTAAEYVKG
jgi:hypothetical protein